MLDICCEDDATSIVFSDEDSEALAHVVPFADEHECMRTFGLSDQTHVWVRIIA